MDDLIKRQSVIDLLEDWGSGCKYIEVETEGAIDAIMEIPAEEHIDVISNYYYSIQKPCNECNDCSYWDCTWTSSRYGENVHYCYMIDLFTDEHFYCKYGEFIDEVIH